MPLFKNSKGKLELIKEERFKLEKDLQTLTEENIETLFSYKFISTELALQNFRIDTLAFDEETNSFVIIEYKRDRSFSVIDQGYSYLALMLNNKADFILEYNEKMKNNLKREDVDWSQSRVIFVAESFTAYQQNAVNFKDLPIELWEVQKYDNGTIYFNQFRSPSANESIKTIAKNETVEKVSREVKKYSVNDHFRPGWDQSRELYEELKDRIMSMDSQIQESAQKVYIGYKIGNQVFIAIHIRKSKVVLSLNRMKPEMLKDPEKRVRYLPNSYKYFNKHISEMTIEELEDIDYAMSLIKQAYKLQYG